MNLIQQLDIIDPQWRRHYGRDPIEAAYDLGLIDDDDLEGTDVPAIDLSDEDASWERYAGEAE